MSESNFSIRSRKATESETIVISKQLLILVRKLALDLKPHHERNLRVDLDSQLDLDLGLDSLSRGELILRAERTFKLQLPHTLLGEADTPRDLLTAILATRNGGSRLSPTVKLEGLGPTELTPSRTSTLIEILDWHVEAHPERPQVVLTDAMNQEMSLTYSDLRDGAKAVAQGLLDWGLEPGERVAIMLPSSRDFFCAFYGIIYANGIPVPIYPPVRLSQIEDHLERQICILQNSGASLLLTLPGARALATLIRPRIESLRSVATVDSISTDISSDLQSVPRPEDTALIQYTSGSTGQPKGVTLSHRNLLTNIRAMGQAMQANSSDVFVSWLPLYHDMGLIGAWLGSLYHGVPSVILSPLTFLSKPSTWLWAINNYGGSLSGAPNFAFELCLKKITDQEIEGLDLSSLRQIVNGAEPVHPTTLRAFTERFIQYGLRPNALVPVYGLAECSVGLTFPPSGRPLLVDRINRDTLTGTGEALPTDIEDDHALEIASCGQPLTGHQIRVIDEAGHELGNRQEGRLQFNGPSATIGYFNNEAGTKKLFDGDWLETGDLAYIADGELYLTGRTKDIIIRAGRNIYPHELEEAIGNVESIRKGCVTVFGSIAPLAGTERIVVMAETRITDPIEKSKLNQRINEISNALLSSPPEDIVLVPPHTIPKTSSGKLRRSACREMYEVGLAKAQPRKLWWQYMRLALASSEALLLLQWRRALAFGFAAYWWSVISMITLALWPCVLLSPVRRWRWTAVRRSAKLLLHLTGTKVVVRGFEKLPPTRGIFIANHASYFDSIALISCIPGELIFVAKEELAGQFFAGKFLRQLGVQFVERFNVEKGVADSQNLIASAVTGEQLVFFPEGTLSRQPGLRNFRLGAFIVATQASLPVIPIILRGTRSILRGDQWFPRRGSIKITFRPPIEPKGRDWEAAVQMRTQARESILNHLGEPDLADEIAPTFDIFQEERSNETDDLKA